MPKILISVWVTRLDEDFYHTGGEAKTYDHSQNPLRPIAFLSNFSLILRHIHYPLAIGNYALTTLFLLSPNVGSLLLEMLICHSCPGLSASIVQKVLHVWLHYLPFSYYCMFDKIMCVLVNFYQRGHFVMPIIKGMFLISGQSWTYL